MVGFRIEGGGVARALALLMLSSTALAQAPNRRIEGISVVSCFGTIEANVEWQVEAVTLPPGADMSMEVSLRRNGVLVGSPELVTITAPVGISSCPPPSNCTSTSCDTWLTPLPTDGRCQARGGSCLCVCVGDTPWLLPVLSPGDVLQATVSPVPGTIAETMMSDDTFTRVVTSLDTIGANYCGPAAPNSTGFPARICASGSPQAAANDVVLFATGMPAAEFGYFLVGQTAGSMTPPGSSGLICLSGSIGRYSRVPEIFQGPTGWLRVDLTAVPVFPPAAVQGGETWRFQAWFRDNNPGLTNNFTDGIEILFN